MIQLFKLYLKNRSVSGVEIVNETKFVQVVQFWFEYLCFTYDFILHKNKDITLLNNPLISKSILYSLDVLEKNENLYCPHENKIKQAIIGLFSFGDKGYMPGGISNQYIDKIQFKLLYNKLAVLKIEINHTFKTNFFNECMIHFDYQTVKLLKEIVPDIFFSSGLTSTKSLPYVLKGSPLCFLDFHYNYIKLLLQPRNIEIIGVQHGGYYGEWIDNPYEKFEKNISDFYYGWGFFNKNIVQNRFKKIPKKIGEREGVFWFGRQTGYVSKSLNFGNYYGNHNQDVNHIDFFYTFFKNHCFKFLPHPNTNPPIYKKVIDKSKYIYARDSIQYVANAKLIVFDCLSHTLMYYCLYNKIPFIIVIDKWPITGLSSSAVEFYDELFNNDLLLFKNDVAISEKLEKLDEKLKDNTTEFYSNSFIKYIDEKFFSHKTIDLI
jgi:hypothetical protein